ncbi:MAG: hypothetical protein M0008_13930 [Actinomycetota bacterium]|nr:hypothetical protein [Actinomycetota bacterium]
MIFSRHARTAIDASSSLEVVLRPSTTAWSKPATGSVEDFNSLLAWCRPGVLFRFGAPLALAQSLSSLGYQRGVAEEDGRYRVQVTDSLRLNALAGVGALGGA